jgi:hypothetical protein
MRGVPRLADRDVVCRRSATLQAVHSQKLLLRGTNLGI